MQDELIRLVIEQWLDENMEEFEDTDEAVGYLVELVEEVVEEYFEREG